MSSNSAPSALLALDDVVAMQAGTINRPHEQPCITITFSAGGVVSLPFATARERDQAMRAFSKRLTNLTAL